MNWKICSLSLVILLYSNCSHYMRIYLLHTEKNCINYARHIVADKSCFFFKIVLLENENEVKKFFIDESIVCFKLFSLYYFVSD